MKKILLPTLLLSLTALFFTACEDVPEAYTILTADEDDIIDPTGSGTASDPFNVAGAIDYLDDGGDQDAYVYVQGIISEIEEVSTSYGNAIYYISDDGTTSADQLEVYHGYMLGNTKFTSEDQIAVGDTVIIYGQLVIYYSTYEFTTGNYIVYLNGESTLSTDDSDAEATGSGTLDDPFNCVAANQYLDNGGSEDDYVYVKGIVYSISELSTSYGNATYYISDDGSSSNTFYVYRGYALGNTKFTSSDELLVGDTVIVYGQIINYYNTIEFAQYNYIVYQNGSGEGGSSDSDDDDSDSDGAGTLASPYTVAQALAIINAGTYTSSSVYVKGTISQIDEISTSYGNATYYISDDGTTTDQLEVYRGYSLNGDKFTSEDEIQVGDVVVVYGVLTMYYSTPEISTGSSIISINDDTSDSSSSSGTTYISEAFTSSLGDFTVYTENGYDWCIDYSTAYISGYQNYANTKTVSWLISPYFDLSDATDVECTFDYIYRYQRSTCKELVRVSLDYDGDDPTAATWYDLDIDLTVGSDYTTFYSAQADLPSEVIGHSNVTIALYYYATASEASTWEVKNFVVADK